MIPAPSIDWQALLPLLIVLGGGVLGLAIETFVPRKARHLSELIVSLVALASAIVLVVWRLASRETGIISPVITPPDSSMELGTLFEDSLSLVFQLVILICSMLAVLVMADRTSTGEGSFAACAATEPGSGSEQEAIAEGMVQTEIYPVTLFSVAGMMAFSSAGDLVTLFVALELLSLPLYILTATARRRRALSQEAAIKYFLLGSFSSAFFLMGSVLLYGSTGRVNLYYIAQNVPALNDGQTGSYMFMAGVLLVLVGLLFKVGAVPFHSWTPDVYQGAPTPVTGFMAAGTKIAAYAALLRFVYYTVPPVINSILPVLWVVIVATILVGTVLGIVQNDVKRMLAYSSIAHTGFILIAILAVGGLGSAYIAVYLLGYGLASVGAFAIVTLVHERGKDGEILGEATRLDNWRGLGKTNPLIAVAMMIFLLSFAGIPLTAGFIGKFLVFSAGVQTGQAWLVVLAVLASAATAFFYFRLMKLMFFEDPDENATVVVKSNGSSALAIALSAILTILIGILPGPILNALFGVFS